MKKVLFNLLIIVLGYLGISAQTTANICPRITILGPTGVTRPGEVMTFSASLDNFSGPAEIKYEWTLSAGIIEKGQETPGIEVRTTRAMDDSNVTATVKIAGIPTGCGDSASETGSVSGEHHPELVDEFGKLTRDDIKARIDNFYIRLNNDPAYEGTIVIRLDEKDTRASKITYLNYIYDAIIFRKHDPARVTFMISEETGDLLPSTRLWMLSPGIEFPDFGDYSVTIKGEDLKEKMKTLFLKK